MASPESIVILGLTPTSSLELVSELDSDDSELDSDDSELDSDDSDDSDDSPLDDSELDSDDDSLDDSLEDPEDDPEEDSDVDSLLEDEEEEESDDEGALSLELEFARAEQLDIARIAAALIKRTDSFFILKSPFSLIRIVNNKMRKNH